MPTFAVLLKYEVVSGLIVEAENEDEAARLATEFEGEFHESIEDSDDVQVATRLWGDGTLELEEVEDADAGEDLIDEWVDEDEDEDEDLDGEDDEFDALEEDDDDESDDDEDDDDEDDAADESDDADEQDEPHDRSHDGDEVDDDFQGELDAPAQK